MKLGPALKLRSALAQRLGPAYAELCVHCAHCHARLMRRSAEVAREVREKSADGAAEETKE